MNWVVGYGSLMNPQSVRRTVPGAGEHRPVLVEGWQRDFELAVFYPYSYRCRRCGGAPQSAAAADAQPQAGAQLAGLAFEVGEEDLQRLDQREVSYRRVALKSEKITPRLPGQAWIYQGRSERRAPGTPLADSYAKLLAEAAQTHPQGASILEDLTGIAQAALDFDPDPQRPPCSC